MPSTEMLILKLLYHTDRAEQK